MRRALIPASMTGADADLSASPGIVSNGHVFLTGMTGSKADGTMPDGIEDQTRNAFAKIAEVLGEANLTHADIVEMTSYHLGLRSHFDTFNVILRSYLTEPFPAWTAVEVAGLRRAGALVEIRVTAALRER